MKILKKIKHHLIDLSSSESYTNYLRNKGVKIGAGCSFRNPRSINIDLTRPSLITIGDYVDFNMGFNLLTHDYVTSVFLRKYSTLISSTGAVSFGNNIFIGRNVIVLKDVAVGNNCVIAAGSVVTKSIPDDTIVGGNPAKPIASIEEYFEKRKTQQLREAVEHYQSIVNRYNREPTPSDFYYEFPLFTDRTNASGYPEIPIRKQLKEHYQNWLTSHESYFDSFDSFAEYAKQQRDLVKKKP